VSGGPIDATLLIATFNRARLLDETLDSIRRMRVSPTRRWEVMVVDNNSTDDTRAVVERHGPGFPVRLQYLFEPRQGRSSALNSGIAAASGTIIAFTDDDVVLADGWLDAACDGLIDGDPSIAYVGGPVRPIWEIPPPDWLDLDRGELWGTIAILNYGDRRFVFEEGRKVPLGANMAMRRAIFERTGGFRPDLGRSSGRLVLGQEVPELLMRVRAAGFRGAYQPAMALSHHVPARRLTRKYFRRWWFGKGISRAALERGLRVTDGGLDLSVVPHVLRVPRAMYGSAVRDLAAWPGDRLRGRKSAAFRHEMMVTYFAGYFWARQRDRSVAPQTTTERPPRRAMTAPR
jgi:glycosyltransferase involved in cell wall biosynthesis